MRHFSLLLLQNRCAGVHEQEKTSGKDQQTRPAHTCSSNGNLSLADAYVIQILHSRYIGVSPKTVDADKEPKKRVPVILQRLWERKGDYELGSGGVT